MTYDAAWLLAELRETLGRPATDAVWDDTALYRYLTRAEATVKPMVAQHYPDAMFDAPTLMTTSDLKVYTLGGSVTEHPCAILVLESLTGDPLKPGPYWDRESDYVWEGENTIRICGGRERSFGDGPYARIVAAPGDVDASTDSTIAPARLRILIVYRAAAYAARRGYGLQEPQYYEDMFDEAAWGVDGTGDTGMLGALKTSDHMRGLAAVSEAGIYPYWRGHS